MPQWAGSSWYFLRYLDPTNQAVFAAKDKLRYWGQVDWYNGGMEHVTRHLIYSRFWNLFLHEIGEAVHAEPYKKRTAQGLILGEDGEKMSKSRGNVIDPMEIIASDGADTLRTYILFIGDYEMPTPWNENGVRGCRRFLDKLWRLYPKVKPGMHYSTKLENLIHKTIKGVSEDLENLKFNTAIAKMMTLVNEYSLQDDITRGEYQLLLKLLSPIASHLCEELWHMLGNTTYLVEEGWPTYDPEKLMEDMIEIVINVNGKVRDKLVVPYDSSDEVLSEQARSLPKIQEWIKGKEIKKVIVIRNKLVNFVVQQD